MESMRDAAAGAVGPIPIQWVEADQVRVPLNADWTVNALAALAVDSNDDSLNVRLFDDTTEEGVGVDVYIPVDQTKVTFYFASRAETAPPAARTVGVKVYHRQILDNGAVSAWSAGLQLTDLDIPTNENFQYDEQEVTLAALGLTAGRHTLFEITRVDPTGGTELVGDWALLKTGVDFA